jgi:hypothetical protein
MTAVIRLKMENEKLIAKDWAFLVLNKHRRQGIATRNFYKLFIYVDELICMENVPVEMREEVKEEVLQTLKI